MDVILEKVSMLMKTPELWLAVAFLVVVVLSVKPLIRGVKMAMLVRASKILKSINSAKNLRKEAEGLLQEYLKKHEHVSDEVAKILEKAKADAARLRKKSEEQLEESFHHREKQAIANINLLKKIAMDEVRDRVIGLTLASVQSVLETKVSAGTQERLVRESVNRLPEQLEGVTLN